MCTMMAKPHQRQTITALGWDDSRGPCSAKRLFDPVLSNGYLTLFYRAVACISGSFGYDKRSRWPHSKTKSLVGDKTRLRPSPRCCPPDTQSLRSALHT